MRHLRLQTAATFVLITACRSTHAPKSSAAAMPPSVQVHSGAAMPCGDRGACPGAGKPLFIIDGVMIDSTKYPVADTTSDPAKRFKPLEPSEIDSIAVVKGDSAIRKYGPAAKNGVILVWTKRAAKPAPPR